MRMLRSVQAPPPCPLKSSPSNYLFFILPLSHWTFLPTLLHQLLTAQVEKDFLRTLSLIRSKDPRIYDKGTEFFKNESMCE